MVCTDFQGLVSSHDQAGFAIFFMFQQTNITRTSFLPLSRVSIKLEQLCAHLEGLLLSLFVSLGFDFFGQANDRFEMNVGLFLIGLVLYDVS